MSKRGLSPVANSLNKQVSNTYQAVIQLSTSKNTTQGLHIDLHTQPLANNTSSESRRVRSGGGMPGAADEPAKSRFARPNITKALLIKKKKTPRLRHGSSNHGI